MYQTLKFIIFMFFLWPNDSFAITCLTIESGKPKSLLTRTYAELPFWPSELNGVPRPIALAFKSEYRVLTDSWGRLLVINESSNNNMLLAHSARLHFSRRADDFVDLNLNPFRSEYSLQDVSSYKKQSHDKFKQSKQLKIEFGTRGFYVSRDKKIIIGHITVRAENLESKGFMYVNIQGREYYFHDIEFNEAKVVFKPNERKSSTFPVRDVYGWVHNVSLNGRSLIVEMVYAEDKKLWTVTVDLNKIKSPFPKDNNFVEHKKVDVIDPIYLAVLNHVNRLYATAPSSVMLNDGTEYSWIMKPNHWLPVADHTKSFKKWRKIPSENLDNLMSFDDLTRQHIFHKGRYIFSIKGHGLEYNAYSAQRFDDKVYLLKQSGIRDFSTEIETTHLYIASLKGEQSNRVITGVDFQHFAYWVLKLGKVLSSEKILDYRNKRTRRYRLLDIKQSQMKVYADRIDIQMDVMFYERATETASYHIKKTIVISLDQDNLFKYMKYLQKPFILYKNPSEGEKEPYQYGIREGVLFANVLKYVELDGRKLFPASSN